MDLALHEHTDLPPIKEERVKDVRLRLAYRASPRIDDGGETVASLRLVRICTLDVVFRDQLGRELLHRFSTEQANSREVALALAAPHRLRGLMPFSVRDRIAA